MKVGAATAFLTVSYVGLEKLLNNSPTTIGEGSENVLSKSPVLRQHLNKTYQYFGGGLLLTVLVTISMSRSRIMSISPVVPIAIGLIGFIVNNVSMIEIRYRDPDDLFMKHFHGGLYYISEAAIIVPLMHVFGSQLLVRVALYTVSVIGGLSVVAMNANNERFLSIGAPIFSGICLACAGGIASSILPAGYVAFTVLENISVVGGLAVFGGFVLNDAQKVIQHGKEIEDGKRKADPMDESVGLFLDLLNIFGRVVQAFNYIRDT